MERDFSSYPSLSNSGLIKELASVLTELTSLYRQQSDIQRSHSQTLTNTYALSQAGTIKDREYEARLAAETYTQELFMVKGEILAEIEARDFLRMLLNVSD